MENKDWTGNKKKRIFAALKHRKEIFMPVSERSENRLNNILMMVKRMPARQQEELEAQLMRMLMLEKAERLQKSVKDNKITIKEIVEEVKRVRDEK